MTEEEWERRKQHALLDQSTGHRTTPPDDLIKYDHCILCGRVKPQDGWKTKCKESWSKIILRREDMIATYEKTWHPTSTTLPPEGVPVDVRWHDMDDPSEAVLRGGEWRDDVFDNLVPTPVAWRERAILTSS